MNTLCIGDISILTLGPLTNVALAASLDPTFTENVNRFYVMGATVNETGNEANGAQVEFNFGLDPESNAIFLNSSTKLKTLIAPWDVVLKNNISKVSFVKIFLFSSRKIVYINHFFRNGERKVWEKRTPKSSSF